MQLIAEAYDILKRALGFKEAEVADVFQLWNDGMLRSFLLQITINILKFDDDDGVPVVSKIMDMAHGRGSGRATTITALESGIAGTVFIALIVSLHSIITPASASVIGEAVSARYLSILKAERIRASRAIPGPKAEPFSGDKQKFIDDLEQALYAARIILHAQAFSLLRATSEKANIPLLRASLNTDLSLPSRCNGI